MAEGAEGQPGGAPAESGDSAGWEATSVDSLLKKPANSVSPDAAKKILRATLKTDKQKRKLREDLFKWAIRTTGLVLVLNFVVIGLYLVSQWNDVEATVMVAWISGTVVEILGIVAIIARYLFEPERSKEPPK